MNTTTASTRSGTPRLLVVTVALDPTADLVLRELNARGVEFWRIDLADFPSRLRLSTQLRPDGRWGGTLSDGRRETDLAELRAIWWRKPAGFGLAEGMSVAERGWAERQARAGLLGTLNSLPQVVWINRPENNQRCDKPRQLAAAAQLGFAVPDTLITDDPAEAAAFAQRHRGHVVTKSLSGLVYEEGGERGGLYTYPVPPEQRGSERIALTAHLFQRRIIDKEYEIRVTVVGDRIFPVEIHAPEGSGRLDWRCDTPNLAYRSTVLPSPIGERILMLLRRFQLRFATLDFIVDSRGAHYLVDVNPNGQWAWVPEFRQRIPNALADLLEKETRASPQREAFPRVRHLAVVGRDSLPPAPFVGGAG
ncbi:MvdC/MvdD family ATP grasp protein [Streptomyces sp. NPDC127098]|uniref:MvdC/MvdD family ATP grasp protein n=1 Tax=Streptomyces sp. NPDC127098 TaxID=3347137 RepID=UPI003648D600